MMPSLSLSSPSSVSTTVRVDKATSELLVGPDWTMNMEICDLCNSNHWMAKDMVKGVKRRLQHKNPRVQLLTLTLLETMVKNCAEYIHFQIAERKILDEMVKIAKKKGDLHVRNKILILLDSWQEAFGGPGGKYAQYFWACDELRRCGIQFPKRPERSAPVITPPVTHPPRAPQIGFGMPSDSSRRLDEAMTSEVEDLSFSTLESMRNALELLSDMLQAVNPSDRLAVKDEVIVDLVDRCRANQKKLMQMITTTTDENLLSQGLEMNDSLQSVLAKHDAIASGAPLPDLGKRISTQQSESVELNTNPSEAGDKHPTTNGKSPVSAAPVAKAQAEDEEEEDEFALLARRHSKTQSGPSQTGTSGVTEDGASSSGSNNALALIDPPAPATTTAVSKDQDLIDLLSLALTTTSTSDTPEAPTSAPVQSTPETSMNSYVVPWAQAQPQPLPHLQNQYQPMQPQMPPQAQLGYSQYASAYPPPPWEQNFGYNNQNLGSNPYMYPNYLGNMNNSSVPVQGAFQYSQYGNQPMYSPAQASSNFPSSQTNRPLQHTNSFQNPPSPSMNSNLFSAPVPTNNTSSTPMQGAGSLQHTNSFTSKVSNPSALNGATLVTNGSASVPLGEKPFVPSYRLFEDLNVFGSSEGKLKSGPYPSASGNPNQNMVSGRR
ncbi:hypothetical protein RND81_04G132900 [Saponaria officinalis]|uniref:Uncharacterized protein n=1 Tax=Saponaria officinalis TaxID=3572 RepID=A0AAW1LKR2_SAPOF